MSDWLKSTGECLIDWLDQQGCFISIYKNWTAGWRGGDLNDWLTGGSIDWLIGCRVRGCIVIDWRDGGLFDGLIDWLDKREVWRRGGGVNWLINWREGRLIGWLIGQYTPAGTWQFSSCPPSLTSTPHRRGNQPRTRALIDWLIDGSLD